MNNLQPYEKHLAEKLQQIPVPDKDEGWKEMRKLLDNDSPEGGAGWGGNRKWWWMGITVAIIIAGLWINQEFSENKKDLSSPSLASTIVSSSNDNATEFKTEKNESELSESKKQETGSINEKAVSVSSTEPLTNATPDRPVEKKKNEKAEIKDNTTNVNNQKETNLTIDKKSNSPASRKQKSNHQSASDVVILPLAQSRQGSTNRNVASETKTGSAVAPSFASATGNDVRIKGPEEKTSISSAIRPSGIDEELFQDPAEIYSGFSLSREPLKAEPGKTDKAFAKEMRKKSIKEDNRKMSSKSMKGISREKDHELTFAAGLSLPQSVAIAGQQSPAYGVNAKPGKLSDYLPVPFFQYHLNNRFFLQTELQFQAPQFTDRLLISQSQHPIAPTNGLLERNVYVEKLYYFHIPFNVYFSPARNFYLGSGLQFSSLLSGVATYQDNRYSNGTLENSSSRVQGFKDDTVAAKLTPSEWRYQLEANYYLKRFTFGARYNQAFSQFVNLQPSPTLPFTQGRNQSFLFYLRYNIWEERKKFSNYSVNNW
jgi:cytoskeletal protein RodZ